MSRAELVHQLQDSPAAARDAGERIIGHHDRQPRLFGEQLVDIAQQRHTAGEDDAALGDVRTEFRWRLFERLLDRDRNRRRPAASDRDVFRGAGAGRTRTVAVPIRFELPRGKPGDVRPQRRTRSGPNLTVAGHHAI